MDDMSRRCCSHVLLQTSIIRRFGAMRPVISSNVSMAISLTTSRPSTTTHDGDVVSRKTCICATSGVIRGSYASWGFAARCQQAPARISRCDGRVTSGSL